MSHVSKASGHKRKRTPPAKNHEKDAASSACALCKRKGSKCLSDDGKETCYACQIFADRLQRQPVCIRYHIEDSAKTLFQPGSLFSGLETNKLRLLLAKEIKQIESGRFVNMSWRIGESPPFTLQVCSYIPTDQGTPGPSDVLVTKTSHQSTITVTRPPLIHVGCLEPSDAFEAIHVWLRAVLCEWSQTPSDGSWFVYQHDQDVVQRDILELVLTHHDYKLDDHMLLTKSLTALIITTIGRHTIVNKQNQRSQWVNLAAKGYLYSLLKRLLPSCLAMYTKFLESGNDSQLQRWNMVFSVCFVLCSVLSVLKRSTILLRWQSIGSDIEKQAMRDIELLEEAHDQMIKLTELLWCPRPAKSHERAINKEDVDKADSRSCLLPEVLKIIVRWKKSRDTNHDGTIQGEHGMTSDMAENITNSHTVDFERFVAKLQPSLQKASGLLSSM